MSSVSEIQALVAKIEQELNETEQEAIKGLNLVRPLLSRFPENTQLTQFFAYFSSVLFFTEMSRTRRIPMILEQISGEGITLTIIQTVGEELSTLLGQVFETKIAVIRLINRLED